MKTTMIHARMEPTLKAEAEQLLHALGLTATQAITLFYRQVKMQRGLPFEVKMPNRLTRQVLKQAAKGHNLKTFKTKKALFDDLGL